MADPQHLQHWLSFFCTATSPVASLVPLRPLTEEEAAGFPSLHIVEQLTDSPTSIARRERRPRRGPHAVHRPLADPALRTPQGQALRARESIPTANECIEIYFAQNPACTIQPEVP